VTAGLDGFQYALRIQRDSGNTGTGVIYVNQSFETSAMVKLANKTVTLSFYARAGANYSSSGLLLGARVVAGSGTEANIVYTGVTGSTEPIITTATLTTSWQRFTATGLIPSGTNGGGVYFFFAPTGTAGANDYVDITGVQLETSLGASSFEQRPIGTEFALCQRYYETSYNGVVKGTNTAVGIVYASSSTDAYQSYVLPSPLWLIPKRATPTVTVYSQAGTINKWNYSRSGVSDAEVTVSSNGAYSSPRSALLYLNTGLAFVSATGYGHFIADAEL
jgi:hypothetical protein